MIKIAPSILAADPLHLERDVMRAVNAGCDWIHVDVMDAHFVPNLAFSPEVVKRLKEITDIPLDVHLMMDQPETLLDAFLKAGANNITVHAEIKTDISGLINKIHGHGASAGIALKPGTPAETVAPYLKEADLILTMTVEPGFGGQKLDERVLNKIRLLRENGYTGEIEADGGIREDNLEMLIQCGLTVAVMGTALFSKKDIGEVIKRLHALSRKIM